MSGRRRGVQGALVVLVLVLAGGAWWAWSRGDDLAGDVTGADLVWTALPSAPHTWHSHLDGARARSLAKAVDAAPGFGSGTSNCPMDNGSAIAVTFDTRSHGSPRMTGRLTGCASLGGHRMTGAMASILQAQGPPGVKIFGS